MATYLLLRNNKESRPLSFDEIIKTGLKPYDLIWINGKSAAWRYANEIPEFIPYAPAEKEQPINISKPQTEEPVKESVTPIYNHPTEISNQTLAREPRLHDAGRQHHQLQESKRNTKVFVSLPEKKVFEKPVTPVVDETRRNDFNSFDQQHKEQKLNDKKNLNTNPGRTEIPVTRYSTEPIELEEKYSQPLDEIKEIYVQTLNQRKKRIARKKVLYTGLKVAAAVSIILAIGVIIGIYYFPGKENNNNNIVENAAPANTNPAELNAPGFVSDARMEAVNANLPINEDATEIENINDFGAPVNEQKEKQVTAKSQIKNKNPNPVPYEGVVVDSQTNERNRVKRDDSAEIAIANNNKQTLKKGSIENIWDDVSIKASDFKTGPFGGIKDLQVTLVNNSAYSLDKVEIEVKYIGIEKQVVKTQRMVFNDVLPGGQVHADVPKTGRGMDVDVSIKKINVKDFSFARSDK